MDENIEDQRVMGLSPSCIFFRWQIEDLRPGPLTPNFQTMTFRERAKSIQKYDLYVLNIELWGWVG